MRKALVVVLALVATLWMLAPPAHAQAPAPKVTITGLVDSLTAYNKNMSMQDLNLHRDSDSEWYGRTRVRPDITAEVGTTKFVLGMELDYSYGTSSDNPDQALGLGSQRGSQHFGVTTGSSINTDITRLIEIKWAYTEFDLPWIPWKTRVRLGAQPFDFTLKYAVYSNADFAGFHLVTEPNPAIKFLFDYVFVDESFTGRSDGFTRSDNAAMNFAVNVTPFKGLDIRPFYSWFNADGPTGGNTRQSRGGVLNSATPTAGFSTIPFGAIENRHTVGIDASWKSGPFSLDPTFIYQFGNRDIVSAIGPFAGTRHKQDFNAFFGDLRGGWQLGPLLLEAAAIYTSGNKSDIRDARKDINYYQPLVADTSYYIGWAEIWALGIDYLAILNARAPGIDPGQSIGYDKYGLMRLGFRPSYAITPAFTVRGAVTANWTAEDIDVNHVNASANGLTPVANALAKKDKSYLGTEADLGFQWRFAPNVALDVVGGYMFAGDALRTVTDSSIQAIQQSGTGGPTTGTSVSRPGGDPKDVKTVVARIRYTF